jgi:F-type H+-transporting ATPase subunit b
MTMDMLALLADASGGPVDKIARSFGVDWPHLIAQIISFGIVCWLLHRFAYRPVLAMLDERRRRIAEGLADAEKMKAELARTEAHRQEALAKADAQATQVIEAARAAAARIAEQEAQKARAAAEQIVDRAREAAERDHDRMIAELKREVGRLVVRTVAAVTGKVLTPDDQNRLVEETAREFAG